MREEQLKEVGALKYIGVTITLDGRKSRIKKSNYLIGKGNDILTSNSCDLLSFVHFSTGMKDGFFLWK